VEGWLEFHFIQNSFKIFLNVNEKVSSKRVFNDQRKDEKKCDTKEEVKKMLKKRFVITDEQFYKYYKVKFLEKTNFDLVINTSSLTPDEVLKRILNELKKHK